jgi:hypothetical protein
MSILYKKNTNTLYKNILHPFYFYKDYTNIRNPKEVRHQKKSTILSLLYILAKKQTFGIQNNTLYVNQTPFHNINKEQYAKEFINEYIKNKKQHINKTIDKIFYKKCTEDEGYLYIDTGLLLLKNLYKYPMDIKHIEQFKKEYSFENMKENYSKNMTNSMIHLYFMFISLQQTIELYNKNNTKSTIRTLLHAQIKDIEKYYQSYGIKNIQEHIKKKGTKFDYKKTYKSLYNKINIHINNKMKSNKKPKSIVQLMSIHKIMSH